MVVQTRSNQDDKGSSSDTVVVQLAAIAKKLESIDALQKDVAVLKSQSHNKHSAKGMGSIELKKAFEGIGVDEGSLVSILGDYDKEALKDFRDSDPVFNTDGSHFLRFGTVILESRENCFLSFYRALLMFTQHPAERDARIFRSILVDLKTPLDVLIEILCTRSNTEIAEAKVVYTSLYQSTVEDDLAKVSIADFKRTVLRGLVSGNRTSATEKVNLLQAENHESDLFATVHGVENPGGCFRLSNVVEFLSHGNKSYLDEVARKYKRGDVTIENDDKVPDYIKLIFKCVCDRVGYFCDIVKAAFEERADQKKEEGLTRVLVTRSGIDVLQIKTKYESSTGGSLELKIEECVEGDLKQFFITLLARNDFEN